MSQGITSSCHDATNHFLWWPYNFPTFSSPHQSLGKQMDLTGWPGGVMKSGLLELKWGSAFQSRNPSTKSVCSSGCSPAQVAVLILSSSNDSKWDVAWGTETADGWYLGYYGSVFSTWAGIQLLTNGSHGDLVQHVLNRACRKQNPFKSITLLSVLWKGRKCAENQRKRESSERSVFKCEACSFLISRKGH